MVLRGDGATRRRLGPPSRVGSEGNSCSNIEEGARSPGFGIPDSDRADRPLALALDLIFWIVSASNCFLGLLRLKGLREIERFWMERYV